jgi:hypothetical protein
MLQQAADVPAGRIGQQRVALLVVEEVRAVLPEALVGMHPRAVVAIDRLRHERHDLACCVRDLLHEVLVAEDLVGRLDERPVADIDLGLTRAADLVMLDLDVDPGRLERKHHLAAQVLERVHRRDREVALLRPWAMARFAVPLRPEFQMPSSESISYIDLCPAVSKRSESKM